MLWPVNIISDGVVMSCRQAEQIEMSRGLCEKLVQQSTTASQSQVICHICSTIFSNVTSLRTHIRGAHLSLKSAMCKICGESFKWYSQLAIHMRRIHGISTRGRGRGRGQHSSDLTANDY